MGQQKYTFAVDVWAIGCIFVELFLKKPFFLGNGYEIEQIFKIFEILGTPSTNVWPHLVNLPDFKASFPKWKRKDLKMVLPMISEKGIDLLEKLLELNPDNRITAQAAMEHEYLNDVDISWYVSDLKLKLQ